MKASEPLKKLLESLELLISTFFVWQTFLSLILSLLIFDLFSSSIISFAQWNINYETQSYKGLKNRKVFLFRKKPLFLVFSFKKISYESSFFKLNY